MPRMISEQEKEAKRAKLKRERLVARLMQVRGWSREKAGIVVDRLQHVRDLIEMGRDLRDLSRILELQPSTLEAAKSFEADAVTQIGHLLRDPGIRACFPVKVLERIETILKRNPE